MNKNSHISYYGTYYSVYLVLQKLDIIKTSFFEYGNYAAVDRYLLSIDGDTK